MTLKHHDFNGIRVLIDGKEVGYLTTFEACKRKRPPSKIIPLAIPASSLSRAIKGPYKLTGWRAVKAKMATLLQAFFRFLLPR